MNKRIRQILKESKKKLQRRLRRKEYCDQARPMFKAGNLRYSLAEKAGAIGYGGIGAMHTLVRKLKLDGAINRRLELLKVHVPYFESDHVLNLAYNVLTGGTCLEDIERLRQDDSYTKGLGAERIPDPTTAGDFLRRFDEASILQLQEAINETRKKAWALQGPSFCEQAVIDVDGTLAETTGECKGGMDLTYKGIWGYAPLIVSLANTNEVLYLVNRPGNAASSQGAGQWIDRAIDLVADDFKTVWVRGDSAFPSARHLDRWDQRAYFVFSFAAYSNMIPLAEQLPREAWKPLDRPLKYQVETEPRRRPENIKEKIVKEKEFKNILLMGEQVAEFDYQPARSEKSYRIVVVRKNLRVAQGQGVLFDDLRYFFYITNHRNMSPQELVLWANARCNQENVIAQLKNGVHALRMPSDDLLSNWAYMVIAALAWNLKSWYGLAMASQPRTYSVLRMEFRTFLTQFILLPCQIVKAGRRLIYRILGYTQHLEAFFATWERIKPLSLA